jgi:epoxyqueuosine reductase
VFKGTAIKRIKLAGLLRNACVVAGNSRDASLAEPLRALLGHASAIVRGHAVWALRRLGDREGVARARAAEADPLVLAEYDGPVEVSAPG